MAKLEEGVYTCLNRSRLKTSLRGMGETCFLRVCRVTRLIPVFAELWQIFLSGLEFSFVPRRFVLIQPRASFRDEPSFAVIYVFEVGFWVVGDLLTSKWSEGDIGDCFVTGIFGFSTLAESQVCLIVFFFFVVLVAVYTLQNTAFLHRNVRSL